MKSWNAFREVPLSAVTPEGWLRRFLEVQRNGLTGHLEAAGFPFNSPGWATREVKHETGTYWWPYEQTAYWVDGMIRCGRLIGDDFLVSKARTQIDYVLKRADKDGYLGPSFLKTEDRTQTGRIGEWPGPRQSVLGTAPQGHGHPLHVVPAAQPEVRFEVTPLFLERMGLLRI